MHKLRGRDLPVHRGGEHMRCLPVGAIRGFLKIDQMHRLSARFLSECDRIIDLREMCPWKVLGHCRIVELWHVRSREVPVSIRLDGL